jgi:hypothetical protein
MRYRASSRGAWKGSCSQCKAKGPIFAPPDLLQPLWIQPLLPFGAVQITVVPRRMRRTKSFVFTDLRIGDGVPTIARFIEEKGGLGTD